MSETASMFIPITINDAVLSSSSIAEDDHAEWQSGTSYAVGDRVIRVTTHSIYEAIIAGVSNAPPEEDQDRWVRVSATMRWLPFDGSLGVDARDESSIQYVLVSPIRSDAVALVNLNAVSVRVRVLNPDGDVMFDENRQIVDVSGVASWLDYFTFENVYETEHVFTGLPVFAANSIEITMDGDGASVSVGEIVFGRQVPLGTILNGSRSGFTDYSRREVDDFGNINLITRPTARKAEWNFIFDTRSNRRIQRELENARGKICFFYPGDGMTDFYLSIFGVADEFYPSLSADGITQDVLSLTGVS